MTLSLPIVSISGGLCFCMFRLHTGDEACYIIECLSSPVPCLFSSVDHVYLGCRLKLLSWPETAPPQTSAP